jgi:hypothetical protein
MIDSTIIRAHHHAAGASGQEEAHETDVFLAEMAAVVPWVALEALIEPHYPKAGRSGGRRPFPLAVMLRIYCLQQWYNLSDPDAEDRGDTIPYERSVQDRQRRVRSSP